MLLTLLHTAPGLIIHLQNHPRNRPWPWGYSRYPELSLGYREEKGPSTLQVGVPLYPNKAKRGRRRESCSLLQWSNFKITFYPPGQPSLLPTTSIPTKQQVKKTREVSYNKPCKDQGPLISACNGSCTAPSKFFRKKETGKRSKKTQSTLTLCGFCYPNAHWQRTSTPK